MDAIELDPLNLDVTLKLARLNQGSYKNYNVLVRLRSGKTFNFPLIWMVFGSENSLDCDLIVLVLLEFVEMKPRPDICNKMCDILDSTLGPIVGTEKAINSSLGYWSDGEIRWAQKGSDLGEINNSIIATFNNHPSLQLLLECPLKVNLKRDVWYKIQTTIRDMLCKMNKSRYQDNPIIRMYELLVSLFNIPEIIAYSKTQKKKYICPILQGVFIQKITSNELILIIPECSNLINKITATAQNKRKRLKPIDEVIDLMERRLDFGFVLMKILVRNHKDGNRVVQLIVALDQKSPTIPREQYEHLRKLLFDLIQSSVIHLNRVIRIVRHIQPLGVRIDCLRRLDLRDIRYLLPIEGIATRYKDMAFKFGQAYSLMDGIELYDKNEIARYYQSSFPSLGVFLRREHPTIQNLEELNEFIRRFLDRIETYPGYSRELCEQYLNQ